MAPKRKRVVLQFKDKIAILDRIKKGEPLAKLAKEFNVGLSTIYDLKKNAFSVTNFVSKLDSDAGDRKTMKKAEDINLDNAVFTWFLQKRSLGEPISGPLLCEKALDFNKRLNGSEEFKASTGWLKNFKSRHGICQLEIQGEKLSVNQSSSEAFQNKFRTIIETYEKENVYNADETGLLWKSLPRKTLASRQESTIPGHSIRKERVTIMICANASASHRLPLLIIGKSKNPRCFKGVIQKPVVYKSQGNGWMDVDIFQEWYTTIFIPCVKKKQEEDGKKGKVLLILDNAPSHPCEVILNEEDEGFRVVFFPSNVAAVLQPMDQGVIETFKWLYRKELLHRLFLTDRNYEGIASHHKGLNLLDSSYMCADAWTDVPKGILSRAWQKLIPEASTDEEPFENLTEHVVSSQIVETLRKVAGCEECDLSDVNEWLSSDAQDPGFQILTEEEILLQAMKAKAEEEQKKLAEEAAGPTHSEAFAAFQTGLKWLEMQEESDLTSEILLRKLRDLAAKKRLKQQKT